MNISDFDIVIELDEPKMAKVVGGAAVDYFLKIDGIEGESQDSMLVKQPEPPSLWKLL